MLSIDEYLYMYVKLYVSVAAHNHQIKEIRCANPLINGVIFLDELTTRELNLSQ